MPESHPAEVTQLLLRLHDAPGDDEAADLLYRTVYNELRRLGAKLMRSERPDHTLQPTALVHEAYLKLVDQRQIEWQNRAHFIGVAARAMRQVLIDHARRRATPKRGGGWKRVELGDALGLGCDIESDVLALDELLNRLAGLDARAARVVELRVFGGFNIKEIARLLGVAPRTVDNDWALAKAWLSRELSEGTGA